MLQKKDEYGKIDPYPSTQAFVGDLQMCRSLLADVIPVSVLSPLWDHLQFGYMTIYNSILDRDQFTQTK